jgi:hypothetical protein
MWNFKRDIYRTAGNNGIAVDLCYGDSKTTACASCDETVTLDPFDYLIITYQYRSDDYRRDLDSATGIKNTGSAEDNKYVGCGQGYYATPNSSRTINTAYLYQPGDDVGNGLGESIVVNFKNMIADNVSINNDVRVELYAGWCGGHGAPGNPQTFPDLTNVSITSYSGGTMSVLNQVITSNGTIIDGPFESHDISVIQMCCGAQPPTKTHIGTIHYNLATKVSNITFY